MSRQSPEAKLLAQDLQQMLTILATHAASWWASNYVANMATTQENGEAKQTQYSSIVGGEDTSVLDPLRVENDNLQKAEDKHKWGVGMDCSEGRTLFFSSSFLSFRIFEYTTHTVQQSFLQSDSAHDSIL